jgi:endoglycosylceramidase
VLDFHDYCLPTSLVSPNATIDAACKQEEGLVFTQESRAQSAASSRIQPGGPAWFVSELGAGCDLTDLGQVANLADQHLASWTYWQWKSYGDPTGGGQEGVYDSCGQVGAAPKLPFLARTYAQAIAGTPAEMSFDVASGVFTLRYAPNPKIHAPTIVFVPTSEHYKNGYCAIASGARMRSTQGNGASHLFLANEKGASSVSLTIRPGRCT